MTKVSIYDPFADVFPTLFRSLLAEGGEPQQRSGAQVGNTQAVPMRVDVSEADGAYTVRADLPGVPKEAIHVDIDGNRVTIRAEVKRETEQKDGERVLRSERYYGAFARSFALTDEIDDDRAAAKFENGVLELTLPKKAVAGAKRLSIQ
ncbi:MAG: Hsp20/alpha crystallin family protein [Burkholderiaceae bacterium]|jgi:HSP20 family protein|nr:Hsp20/alpha crystallin family protein [Burkholderiales bacterium]MCZ8103461.1 Hsp20/alpha crystallin family protein [Burkholderiales bacterium]MCZ8341385.1 Hsp20/alpha crystallin family protein [Burkholderiaceae bacterium]